MRKQCYVMVAKTVAIETDRHGRPYKDPNKGISVEKKIAKKLGKFEGQVVSVALSINKGRDKAFYEKRAKDNNRELNWS